LKAPKVPKVKRPGTAYALFVKEKYTSISDMFPAGERSVSVVRSLCQVARVRLARLLQTRRGLQPAQWQQALFARAGTQALRIDD